MPVCPILKVTEALYKGGIQALPEGDESCSCKIDEKTYVFDDAPVIVGLGAFDSVRRGGSETIDVDSIESVGSLRAADSLHMLEIRKSIKDLIKTGAAEVPTKDDIVNKYTKKGGLKESERAMVSRIKELVEH